MDKTILHVDLDTFFVSCQRLVDTSLKNIPLIIAGGGSRGVVTCASNEAKAFGVRTGMPKYMAYKLCPVAKVVKGDFELYNKCSETVTEIIQENAPLMEKSTIDEFYLDITGMDRYFGALKWSKELKQTVIKESGLPLSFGLSINKTVSKIATTYSHPFGELEIKKERVSPFINPLSIRALPGIGQTTFETLSRIGIRKIGTLAEVPSDVMFKFFGKRGKTLSLRAKGIDNTPVKPYSKKQYLTTEQTLYNDTIDKVLLHSVLSKMVEELCFKMRSEYWLTSNVSVKIKYTNLDTHSKQLNIPFTSCDFTLRRHAATLLNDIYQRRMRIRLIGLSFNKLAKGSHQIDLFSDTEEKIKLFNAMDKIKKRFHPDVIQWGTGFLGDYKNKIEEEEAQKKKAAQIAFPSQRHLYESVGGHTKYNR